MSAQAEDNIDALSTASEPRDHGTTPFLTLQSQLRSLTRIHNVSVSHVMALVSAEITPHLLPLVAEDRTLYDQHARELRQSANAGFRSDGELEDLGEAGRNWSLLALVEIGREGNAAAGGRNAVEIRALHETHALEAQSEVASSSSYSGIEERIVLTPKAPAETSPSESTPVALTESPAAESNTLDAGLASAVAYPAREDHPNDSITQFWESALPMRAQQFHHAEIAAARVTPAFTHGIEITLGDVQYVTFDPRASESRNSNTSPHLLVGDEAEMEARWAVAILTHGIEVPLDQEEDEVYDPPTYEARMSNPALRER
ncbi:unnamed protein product [Diplocarpon coronariae]|uniref:Uncharacterized protein n=1 Tax=Diplocarpon coronariae TaxID=2795749 RepID=A0A218ZHN5_9HELO|nr:hypothetical protein B2J93_5155 [Marssonina coronariae]